MELTRKTFLRFGESISGGAAVPGLVGCTTSVARQQGEHKGLVELNLAEKQTKATRIWMTPAAVIEDRKTGSAYLVSQQLMWRNEDLEEITDDVREIEDPMANLQDVIRGPVDPELILPHSLHRSLEKQRTMVASLVERLAAGRGR